METKKITSSSLPNVDDFKILYYDLKDKSDDDQTLFNRDITPIIYKFFYQKIKEDTLINIAVRGEPGIGKSVLALQLMHDVNKIIEKGENKEINRYNQIASDQGELLRKAKDKTCHHTCVEVDEFDPLASSGANATTEMKEFEFFSDLCRLYYIHRIQCSPTKIADPNVNIVFDAISKDKENKRTLVKVLYRNSLEGRWVQLGVAWIDVAEVLEEDWFKQYEKKKKARVDLLTEHGIRGVRELEFAFVAKNIIKEISLFLEELDDKSSINSLLRIKAINQMQELYQRPISFIAEDEIIKPAQAMILLLQSIHKLTNDDGTPKPKKERAVNAFKLELKKSWEQINHKVNLYKEYGDVMFEK